MSLTELAERPNPFLKCIRELTYSAQSQGHLENNKTLSLKAKEAKQASATTPKHN